MKIFTFGKKIFNGKTKAKNRGTIQLLNSGKNEIKYCVKKCVSDYTVFLNTLHVLTLPAAQ